MAESLHFDSKCTINPSTLVNKSMFIPKIFINWKKHTSGCFRDHAGGNEELCSKVPGLRVYGGDARIGALTNQIAQGDYLQVNKV